MLEDVGCTVKAYASPEVFLAELDISQVVCIIVDYRMPSMSGLQMIKKARELGCPTPFVVVTGFGNVTLAVDFMKLGAITVLEKPFYHHQFMECITSAIALDVAQRTMVKKKSIFVARIALLTDREANVLELICKGRKTTQIAEELNLSLKTVESHRGNIIRKMEADSMNERIQCLLFEISTRSGLNASPQ